MRTHQAMLKKFLKAYNSTPLIPFALSILQLVYLYGFIRQGDVAYGLMSGLLLFGGGLWLGTIMQRKRSDIV